MFGSGANLGRMDWLSDIGSHGPWVMGVSYWTGNKPNEMSLGESKLTRIGRESRIVIGGKDDSPSVPNESEPG